MQLREEGTLKIAAFSTRLLAMLNLLITILMKIIVIKIFCLEFSVVLRWIKP